MAVSTNTFSTFVSNSVAAIQGAASQLLDLTVGSVLRSFVDAYSLLALWLQAVALQLASITRLSTSSGTDVDTFINDYGFFREPATAASGPVTFARFTPTAQATIPVGDIVQTPTGVQYQTIADTTQTAFNATLNAYVIPPGTASITATVAALVNGSAGNAVAGAINVLASSIPGVDTVTNVAAFTSGEDAESDQAVKAGFILYLQSLTQGTVQACENAVTNLQVGATCSITENINLSGASQPGYFYAVVDDGTGHPSGGFLAAATAAIDKVRAEGTTFSVVAPTLLTANIALTIAVAAGFTESAVKVQVAAALTAFVNALSEGATLPYTRLAQIAYDASPGVTNVTGVTLNGGTADLVSAGQQLIRVGTVTVSP